MNESKGAAFKKVDEYLIEAVIKAKEKETVSEKRVIRAGTAVLLCTGFLVMYVIYQWSRMTQMESAFLLNLIADPIVLMFMLIIGLTYAILQNEKYKYEKAEKDYDLLKEDIIDRASEIWSSPESWEERAELFSDLKQKHNINLYHK
ncbi:DUF2663 family protein [Salipaludibacillus aurantiacus]|uniref:DUF2663 family protein n=1 Tax=Salipaludibacillus aurantiacus TaxID=1601833 RepID=A0A1H9PBA2_9BACI|nr:DUF2663 family protein [Salipaludibacillus aurantiacus]SER45524.1 Protein of unknown function [Salipaludibacillus aurantiacus]